MFENSILFDYMEEYNILIRDIGLNFYINSMENIDSLEINKNIKNIIL